MKPFCFGLNRTARKKLEKSLLSPSYRTCKSRRKTFLPKTPTGKAYFVEKMSCKIKIWWTLTFVRSLCIHFHYPPSSPHSVHIYCTPFLRYTAARQRNEATDSCFPQNTCSKYTGHCKWLCVSNHVNRKVGERGEPKRRTNKATTKLGPLPRFLLTATNSVKLTSHYTTTTGLAIFLPENVHGKDPLFWMLESWQTSSRACKKRRRGFYLVLEMDTCSPLSSNYEMLSVLFIYYCIYIMYILYADVTFRIQRIPNKVLYSMHNNRQTLC